VDELVHVPDSESEAGQRQSLIAVMRQENITAATTTLNNNDRAQTIALIAKQDPSLLAFGTDVFWLPPGQAFHQEVGLLCDAGLTPQQIIQAATRNAAIHLGREDDLGTVEAGKIADLIVVDGNPLNELAALENIELVVQGGEIVVDNRDK